MTDVSFRCTEPMRWFTRIGTADIHARSAVVPGMPVYEGEETREGDVVLRHGDDLFLVRHDMPLLPGALFLPFTNPALAAGEPRRLASMLAGMERSGRLVRDDRTAVADDPETVLENVGSRLLVARGGPVLSGRPSPFARRIFRAIERCDAVDRMDETGATLFIQDSGFEPETSLRLMMRGHRTIDTTVTLSALDRYATMSDGGDVSLAKGIHEALGDGALGCAHRSVLTRYPEDRLDEVVDAAVAVVEGIAGYAQHAVRH